MRSRSSASLALLMTLALLSIGHVRSAHASLIAADAWAAGDVTGLFCTRGNERLHPWGRRLVMAKSRTKPEQIVTLLRQIEVAIANGKSTAQACKEAAVTEQTYYRW